MSDDAARLALGNAIAGDTFRNLVGQFSQELCFYRELIQNAVDAGSRTVEVRVEYDEARGMAVAHVVDSGCGMDRAVIDSQLTRLFSSSKEDDFTKIGKFGIGFVSVFSLRPEAVVVDTARSGECWRVLFSPDGSFERIELDTPMEGTHVQVFKAMARDDFADFVGRSRATVDYWCRHAEAEIVFNGERVDVPFDLDAPVKVHVTRQGTEIVAALAPHEEPFFGFYNGGITLLEGRLPWIAGVAFKLKSRLLEHTLTRDNVKQDANFDKAMRMLKSVVENELETELRARLLGATGEDRRAVLRVVRGLGERLPRDLAFLPCCGGPPLAPRDLRRVSHEVGRLLTRLGADACPPGAVLHAPESDALTAALHAAGIAVCQLEADDALIDLLEGWGWRPLEVHTLLAMPAPVAATEGLRRIAERAQKILAASGIALSPIRFGRFCHPSVGDRPYVVQRDPDLPCAVRPLALLGEDQSPGLLTGFIRQHVVLNVDHPLVRSLGESEALGPYLLAKLLCLSDGLHPETERRLLAAALS